MFLFESVKHQRNSTTLLITVLKNKSCVFSYFSRLRVSSKINLFDWLEMRTTALARLAASRTRCSGAAIGEVKKQTLSDKLNTDERATYARVSFPDL